MPMPTPDPRTIVAFESARAFERWLRTHHAKETEVYVRMYKKNSGVKTVTPDEAIDVALCWGWIDGVRRAYDAQSFLQRFTPRRPKSVWSQVNRERVARLIEAGRMTPEGLSHVEAAKADGRWQAAYAAARDMTLPEDLRAAIDACPEAARTFATLSKQNLFALAFRVGTLRTPAGRAKKIESLVAMLARGETPHPYGKPRRPG